MFLFFFFMGLGFWFFLNNPGSPETCRHLSWRIPTGPHQPLDNRVPIFSYVKNSSLNSFIKWFQTFGINLQSDTTLIVETILVIKNLTLS